MKKTYSSNFFKQTWWKIKFDEKKNYKLHLFAFCFLLASLIFSFFIALFFPTTDFANLPDTTKVSNYFAFFTTQSNIILCSFFFISLFVKNHHQDWFFLLKIAAITYISITFTVYWGGVVAFRKPYSHYHPLNWVVSILLHIVNPICGWFIFALSSGDYYYKTKKHHLSKLWVILLYPFLYLLAILIRGLIRINSNQQENTWFPYFFLNWKTNGIAPLVLGIFIIFLLAVFFQYLFLILNDYSYLKNRIFPKTTLVKFVKKQFQTYPQTMPWNNKIKRNLIILFVAAIINLITFLTFYILLLTHFKNSAVLNFIGHINYINTLIIINLVLSIALIILVFFSWKKKDRAYHLIPVLTCIICLASWFVILLPILFAYNTISTLLHLYNNQNNIINSKWGNNEQSQQLKFSFN